MKLSETIEGVYISAYFRPLSLISFFSSATEPQSWFTARNREMHNNFEIFSHFYYSITQNVMVKYHHIYFKVFMVHVS